LPQVERLGNDAVLDREARVTLENIDSLIEDLLSELRIRVKLR
jgi:hypothetical protein